MLFDYSIRVGTRGNIQVTLARGGSASERMVAGYPPFKYEPGTFFGEKRNKKVASANAVGGWEL
jgi:hypothetical protein